jgi:hypothetical protein
MPTRSTGRRLGTRERDPDRETGVGCALHGVRAMLEEEEVT